MAEILIILIRSIRIPLRVVFPIFRSKCNLDAGIVPGSDFRREIDGPQVAVIACEVQVVEELPAVHRHGELAHSRRNGCRVGARKVVDQVLRGAFGVALHEAQRDPVGAVGHIETVSFDSLGECLVERVAVGSENVLRNAHFVLAVDALPDFSADASPAVLRADLIGNPDDARSGSHGSLI